MGRTIWWLGALGLVAFGVSAVLGHQAEGWEAAEGITLEVRLHLLVGAAGALLIFFADGWVALYLSLTGRLLRRHVPADRAADDELAMAVYRGSRWGVPLAVLAALTAVATILLGMPALTGFMEPVVHLAVGAAALVLQVLALGTQWSLLGRHETLIRRTDRALAA
jgi:hypothetical protein